MPTGMQSTETHREVEREVYREVDRQGLPSRPRFYWSRLSKAQPEVDREVYQIDQDSIEASFRERNHEVNRMVTEADFQRRLPSQPHLGVNATTSCKRYSTEHAEALHEGSREHRRSNLVSITILEKLTN